MWTLLECFLYALVSLGILHGGIYDIPFDGRDDWFYNPLFFYPSLKVIPRQ